jgi:hypothetical protein
MYCIRWNRVVFHELFELPRFGIKETHFNNSEKGRYCHDVEVGDRL